ncbi:MAG: PfkB family carbohydrate kinase [Acidobacteriota bacterium]
MVEDSTSSTIFVYRPDLLYCSSVILMTDLTTIITTLFRQKKIIVLGDVVADQFLNGTISRVSREAPVFILRHDVTNTLPGAAANAAVNIASLGGKPILIGLIGKDETGTMLSSALQSRGVDTREILSAAELSTTTKVRILAGRHYATRQQVIRIDYENSGVLTDDIKLELRNNLANAADTADAIIVSDYNYGVVFPEIFDDARSIAARLSIPLIVDSRFKLTDLAGASTATPNREEVEQILGKNFNSADCSVLREQLGYTALLVTNGDQGMMLFEKGSEPLQIDAVGPTEPVDVTGAGDTVIAAYALGLASGLSYAEAATVANHAGGIVVMKKGTASIDADELAISVRTHAAMLSSQQAL